MLVWWILLLVSMSLVTDGLVAGCVCPAATVLSQFPSKVPADVCCLNFSGSAFSHVRWSVFTNETSVETLDLSNCNISSVDRNHKETSSLQKVLLGQNRLTELPREFLANQTGLVEVDLSRNLLEELPEGFLQDSEGLQKLNLQGNRLRFLPGSILQKPRLQRLELDGNYWDCSCLLLGGLEAGEKANRTTRLQDLVENLTCSSPRHLAGRTVWSVRLSDVCRPAGLTALFIILPLLILSALLLCWCCGRKRKKKEAPVFNISKKRAPSSSCNGQKHPRNKQQPSVTEPSKDKEGVLKNQLLLHPASTLLGSTRDIYEEVEIKLGSVESLPRVSSRCSSSQEPDGASKTELDTVSVTEVMKDSADREKAYMTQSTEYYSLVPGMELEDSDHGDYENVHLS
ncbi:leucine-rich repeat-containing protein 38 [Amphiprion ocellaris]|uniref:LRRCT domain-containing protein n=1 Tax=Amphiprion ocellaris TaxID=80972 RepID=A0A3Q1BGY3_AMPOC|nr:leucine-rich repeat-containing protein 38 [Amphiprion ocellaris]XP_054870622.1 leucine-rich repeat-containing protein 38 [Amphiprion ocellaris]